MANPRILWDNEVADATLTATAEDSGYPVENIATWLDYDVLQGSGANSYAIEIDGGSAGITATALAIVGHNLNTVGARYKLEGSNNADSSAPDWTSVVAYQTPGNDFCRADFFTQVNYEVYKLTIDNNGGANFTFQIGIVFLGTYLTLERPPSLPHDPDEIEDFGTRNRSETGYSLGRALDHSMRQQRFTFDFLTHDWITNTWKPFRTAHRNNPIIFAWDPVGHATEIYLMEIGDTRFTQPIANSLYRSLDLSLTGRLEE